MKMEYPVLTPERKRMLEEELKRVTKEMGVLKTQAEDILKELRSAPCSYKRV